MYDSQKIFVNMYQMYQDWNNWNLFSQKNSIFQVIFRFTFQNVLRWEYLKLFSQKNSIFQVIFRFTFPNVLRWEHLKLFTRNKNVFLVNKLKCSSLWTMWKMKCSKLPDIKFFKCVIALTTVCSTKIKYQWIQKNKTKTKNCIFANDIFCLIGYWKNLQDKRKEKNDCFLKMKTEKFWRCYHSRHHCYNINLASGQEETPGQAKTEEPKVAGRDANEGNPNFLKTQMKFNFGDSKSRINSYFLKCFLCEFKMTPLKNNSVTMIAIKLKNQKNYKSNQIFFWWR